jgi:hypothetical protein
MLCSIALQGKKYAFAENHFLVGFINDEPIDATKAQETFEVLRIKKHYVLKIIANKTNNQIDIEIDGNYSPATLSYGLRDMLLFIALNVDENVSL